MLTTTTNKIQYSGNGSTTEFSFPYLFLDDSHLVVVLTDSDGDDTTQVITTNYTVSGAGDDAGGAVTMVTPPALGETLTITRVVPLTQVVDYIANDAFPAETHETALDRLTMLVQQLSELDSRCLRFPSTEPSASNAILGSKTDRADTIWYFDENGDLTYSTASDFVAGISPTLPTLTMGSPTGNATTKSVSLQITTVPAIVGYFKIKVWLVDGSNTVPTLEESLSLPDGIIQKSNWEVLTDNAGEVTIPLTHEGSSSSWRICASAWGQAYISDEITLGV